MAGGLLNLISSGSGNLIIFGNPKSSYFRAVYKKITNFGIQKIRVDYEGSRNLRFTDDTVLDFTIPRYADLLYDTYLVVTLPDIWSPIYYNVSAGEYTESAFQWIENLGSMMIRDVEILCDGTRIGHYEGEYFMNMAERDYDAAKKDLWNRMTGNIAELNDPANALGRVNIYPTAYYLGAGVPNIEPSIRGRQLFIPIDAWFGTAAKLAFPLIAVQYNEMHIRVTLRPIQELYRIRDVEDDANDYPYIAPNTSNPLHQLYRFINQPEDDFASTYSRTINDWNADIHLMCNYVFLDNVERTMFATQPQRYLIRQIYPLHYYNVTGSSVVDLDSRDLVTSYMFSFRRSDAYQRNEWSNYTNWPYKSLPYQVSNFGSPSATIFITGAFQAQNIRPILLDMAITLNGKYRENLLPAGVYEYMEKYRRTKGGAKDGLFVYSFALDADSREYQPSGAMNMTRFKDVRFEFNTQQPPASTNPPVDVICDGSGNLIGTRKNLWSLNEYNYDLTIYEERLNVLVFESGMCGLLYAR